MPLTQPPRMRRKPLKRAATLLAALSLYAGALPAQSATSFVFRVPLGPSSASLSAQPGLSLSSTRIDFGSVAVTETDTAQATLTNFGSTAAAVTVAGPSAPFSLSHDCPTQLAPAASCLLTFAFTPTAAGAVSGMATISGQAVELVGRGDALMVTQIATATYHTLVRRADGTVWATGRNTEGQLGLGNNIAQSSFTQVLSLGTSAASIIAGFNYTLVLKNDGTLWATGRNDYGQLGLGDKGNRSSFTQVTSMGTSAAQVVAGNAHTMVVKKDGTLWATGFNVNGELGVGDTVSRTSFTQVASLGTAVAKTAAEGSHTMVVKKDGTLWAAGHNYYGQLGLGDTTSRSVFTQVTAMSTAAASVVTGGEHTLIVKKDGTLWATGDNSRGQLGLGDTAARTSFTQVASMGTAVGKVGAGGDHTLVVKKDGTLWAAGRNNEGELGLGDTADRLSFVQVGNAGNSASLVVGGANHTFLRTADGTLWATGYNVFGQLGLGDTTTRNVLTQVP